MITAAAIKTNLSDSIQAFQAVEIDRWYIYHFPHWWGEQEMDARIQDKNDKYEQCGLDCLSNLMNQRIKKSHPSRNSNGSSQIWLKSFISDLF